MVAQKFDQLLREAKRRLTEEQKKAEEEEDMDLSDDATGITPDESENPNATTES